MLRRSCALLLGATLALAEGGDGEPAAKPHPARAPGKKPATVAIRKKVFSFALPADWVLSEVEAPNAELAWNVFLPGATEPAELLLVRDEGYVNSRSAPYYHKESQTWEGETEVRPSPVPRLVVTRPGRDWMNTYMFFAVRNNPYYFHLSCADEDFPQAEQDLIAGVQGLAADVAIWPPIPKGYETKQDGNWLIAKAPSATAPLAPLIQGLKEAEKRFQRQHGTLPKGDPIVVLVQGSAPETKRIEPEASGAADGFYADVRHRRVLAVPVAKEDLEQRGRLAEAAHGVLFVTRYGDTRPNWVWAGECAVANVEAVTGKPLPSIDEGFATWVSKLSLHTLDELEELRRTDLATYGLDSFFYVGMLHTGKHKKAYGEFLEEFARTGDGVAFERRFFGIGQEELRAATKEFASKVKMEKRKPAKPGK
ncbi:MAG: hypothetical protein ACHQ1G_10700 [Planctomycetota bacterium]